MQIALQSASRVYYPRLAFESRTDISYFLGEELCHSPNRASTEEELYPVLPDTVARAARTSGIGCRLRS